MFDTYSNRPYLICSAWEPRKQLRTRRIRVTQTTRLPMVRMPSKRYNPFWVYRAKYVVLKRISSRTKKGPIFKC